MTCIFCDIKFKPQTQHQNVCVECFEKSKKCEVCCKYFLPHLTQTYGLLSLKRCVKCIETVIYVCISCGNAYCDYFNTTKYKKCPNCENVFFDVKEKYLKTEARLQIIYDAVHWQNNKVYKHQHETHHYINIISNMTPNKKILHVYNIVNIMNIYQLNPTQCHSHEECIKSYEMLHYKLLD